MSAEKIELRVLGENWVAKFSGSSAERIRELFGTDTIQTPFRFTARAEYVQEQVQSRNPDAIVTVVR